ncbi:endolytic transglycosylase MltG [Shewanella sp. SR43-4]|uniref:Endolytic murein transglycosylase n=1 Tax=Shewanella vesiculosa TaxID=518738 RepID=A0ABV0FM27_9GAMM|nr:MULTISPECIES: endolytic transglycosylase MltG [Shewanella]MBB1316893.1 endolytic transglycosylase MltG [Shewanella sp. SR43-4]MBB1321771.1 endolytic transglycosylase MltG [Shewanella sp. SR43-8]MBB1388473.1 endolytic transglycosylase MltG [Shewanella sp. SG44-6]RPA55381.1 endolytic transglycosylase MltG [Shewanella vesiculosa]UJL43408.1 endolytic transglycosylase MltG [Shewanella vesiculosa]|tara:strand:+ start:5000 stop:6013 length:1014 start_codon:yes stop_codon:yes gene_type:complete
MIKKIKTFILASLIPLFTLTCIGGYWLVSGLMTYQKQPLQLTESQTLTVEPGTSVIKLAQQLEQQSLITDSWKVKYLVKLEPKFANIKTGLYQLIPGDTLEALLKRLYLGQQVVFSVTLIEGKTIAEWQQTLATTEHLAKNADDFNQVLLQHGDTSGLPEGKFYPETFHYHADDNLQTILNRSYNMMQESLAQAWEGRDPDLALSSPYELLIIASIIEKETGKPEERDWVSAVFNNRLKKGMRLQTDPTVIYGMGERYKGNITRKDLRQATAFNTYTIDGLPPTPIAAPSRASLFAAANPANVNYLYFVSRNDGSHVFSSTLKAHNNAVNEFQRKRK